ncbi:acetylcholinesterase-1-like isoform X2 [Ornithodoros turicata]|uniref:acetylcholinesterase-1-like isoform X2 n=1 Tax=Ornithodoros turicata TaxID=34597 RepID=UPI00313A1BE1
MDSGTDTRPKKDPSRRSSHFVRTASSETVGGTSSPPHEVYSRRSSKASRVTRAAPSEMTDEPPSVKSRRSSRLSRRPSSPGETMRSGATRTGHRSSLWERNSDSLEDALERVSAAQAAFEDSSRVRTISQPRGSTTKLQNLGPLPRSGAGTSTPLAGKILIVVLLLIISLLALLYHLLLSSDSNRVTVEAKWSTYRGTQGNFDGRPVFTFMGIPFGADMSGQRRFRKPQAVQAPEVLQHDATRAKPSCNQAPLVLNVGQKEETQSSAETSEECLYLNVWTPSLPSRGSNPKTVLVFLYSIAFKWGSNNDYNATPLSALGDIVVVVPNYRLHALGFLEDNPGNLALYDQLLALDWVRENIEAFGGNISSIVLHGYESGAVSIGYHMVSPHQHWVKNTSRLILQSGSPFQLYRNNTSMSYLVGILGCPSTGWACLRNMNTEEYRTPSFYRAFHFGPYFHSKYLPEHPHRLLRTTPIANKQVLLGNVLDEASFLTHVLMLRLRQGVNIIAEPMITLIVREELLAAGVEKFDSARQEYANDTIWNSNSGGDAAKELFGDAFFNCPVQYLAAHLAEHGSFAYKYVWTHKPSFGPWALEGFGPTQYDDLAFVFGTPLLEGSGATIQEHELTRRTIDLFSNFAKTGELPMVQGKPWPKYTMSDPSTVEIGAKELVLNDSYRVQHCPYLKGYIMKYS